MDTNVIINREASYVRHEDVGKLFYWLDKLNYGKFIHPITVEEINNHKDSDVKKTFSVKLDSYELLKTEPPEHELIKTVCTPRDSSQNDINDTKLLNQLINNRVDFLITEDKKLYEKSKLINVNRKVFTIESFLEKVVSENPDLIDYKTLSTKKDYFGNVNLQDTFFDSFREDYVGFDDWFNKKSNELSYVCLDKDKTLAFLYIKKEDDDEDYSNIFPIFSKKKRLKIGTFKVALNGYRLGERFLKIIFDNAISQKVDEIYVTIFNKSQEQQRLIYLLS